MQHVLRVGSIMHVWSSIEDPTTAITIATTPLRAEQQERSWSLEPFWVPGHDHAACTTSRFDHACMELNRGPEPKMAPNSWVLM
jgi:hypothetical protein